MAGKPPVSASEIAAFDVDYKLERPSANGVQVPAAGCHQISKMCRDFADSVTQPPTQNCLRLRVVLDYVDMFIVLCLGHPRRALYWFWY